MSKSLVIVESPAKGRTISKFLSNDYEVTSTMGHLMDLPTSRMGVDINNGFKPEYVVIKSREKLRSELKKKAKDKDKIFLATDPDREGETISWHLSQELKSKENQILRVEFHQVTKDAVIEAFSSPRDIDMNKVNAQQARRILDRIVGYTISPLLWKKVSYGLSAGRVQSVVVRLIVEREEKIKAFVSQEYWEIEAELKKKDETALVFTAKLDKIDDEKAQIKDKQTADSVVDKLETCKFHVSDIKEARRVRMPSAPYTTSKLQQDAFNKLQFSAERTMRIAQQLYEGLEIKDEGSVGLITYMRTDSVNVAKSAQEEAASYVVKEFGAEYLPKAPHKFKTRQRTQGAHEAIRPTSVFRHPDKIKDSLNNEQYKLYKLVWQRFVQSQMKQAVLNTKTIEIKGQILTSQIKGQTLTSDYTLPGSDPEAYLFKSVGTEVVFDGFLKLNSEEYQDTALNIPKLSLAEELVLLKLIPSQHFTKPPARYTDASLVKELEEKGIGRPSTYAPIISTIIKRHYARREKGSLYPTDLGNIVTELLVKAFPHVLDVKFTARMEDELDKIEEGRMKWQDVLLDFYNPFSERLAVAQKKMEDVKKREQTTEYKCELCGRTMVLKWSRRGKFLSCSGFPKCKSAKRIKENPDGTFDILEDEKTDQVCDICGRGMVVKHSRHGRFLSCSGYPKCKNAKPISTGVKCTQEGCNGELLERYSRGRMFYACSNYPNCRYTAKELPCSDTSTSS